MQLRFPLLVLTACVTETRIPAAPVDEGEVVGWVDVPSVHAPGAAGEEADGAVPGVEEVTAPIQPALCPMVADPQVVASCTPFTAAITGGMRYSTVEAASDAAGQGGTVVVCPGTWPASLDLPDNATLVAADPYPNATVLVGDGTRPIVTARSGAIEGLTLTGGRATRGGAVLAYGDFTLECVTATSNEAEAGDGGVAVAEGALVVRWSTFSHNNASANGGALSAARLEISDSVFDDNDAVQGGALYTTGDLTMDRVTFGRNGGLNGGAVAVGSYVRWSFQGHDLVFDDNQADRGGAVWVRPYAVGELRMERVLLSANASSNGAAAMEVSSDRAVQIDLVDTEFSSNLGGQTGGIAITGWLDPGAQVSFERVHFLDNEGDVGGALVASSVVGHTRIDAQDLRVWNNRGPLGAVVLAEGDTLACDPCDFGADDTDNIPADATVGNEPQGALPAMFEL